MRAPVGGGAWVRLGSHPDLLRVAGELEPATVPVSGALRERRSTWGRLVVSVEDRGGALLGALVLDRASANRWSALPLVLDGRSRPVLARLVDLSWASRAYGVASHLEPLVPGLSRVDRETRIPLFAVPPGAARGDPVDGRTRVAGLADVPGLLAVLTPESMVPGPSARARRRFVERAVDQRLAVVAEVDGRIVGGALADPIGESYVSMTDLAVHPDHRGQGLAWAMIFRLSSIATELGYGFCGMVADSNPMDFRAYVARHGVDGGRPVDEWLAVRLRSRLGRSASPRVDRQVRRVHRVLDRLDRRRAVGARWARPTRTA